MFPLSCYFCKYVGLNLDRLYAIKRPIGYQSAIQRHGAGKVVLFSWVINLIPGIPLLFDETISEAFLHGCDGCYKPMLNVSYISKLKNTKIDYCLNIDFLAAFLGLVPGDDGLCHPVHDNGHHLGQHGPHYGDPNQRPVISQTLPL